MLAVHFLGKPPIRPQATRLFVISKKTRYSHSNDLFMSVRRVVEGMLGEFQAAKPPFQHECEAFRVSN